MQKWIFAVAMCGVTSAAAAPNARIESLFPLCGVYRVTGKVECSDSVCGLILFPGTRSELKADLKVEDPKIIQHHFQNANIQIKVSYSGPGPFILKALERIPKRSRPSKGARAVQLEEEEDCHASP